MAASRTGSTERWVEIMYPRILEKVKVILLGSRTKNGILVLLVLYALLIAIGFVYLYPLLYMFITSMKSPSDLLNPMVQWVPSQFYVENYIKAFHVLDYPKSLLSSTLVSVIPSLLQTVVCSLVGYGLARYRFWGKNLLFVLI